MLASDLGRGEGGGGAVTLWQDEKEGKVRVHCHTATSSPRDTRPSGRGILGQARQADILEQDVGGRRKLVSGAPQGVSSI